MIVGVIVIVLPWEVSPLPLPVKIKCKRFAGSAEPPRGGTVARLPSEGEPVRSSLFLPRGLQGKGDRSIREKLPAHQVRSRGHVRIEPRHRGMCLCCRYCCGVLAMMPVRDARCAVRFLSQRPASPQESSSRLVWPRVASPHP